MKLLMLTALALLIGAIGSGFLIKGTVFNLGILAGVEFVRWAERRQARIKSIGQIRIDLGGGGVDLTGTFSYYNGHWEFRNSSTSKLYFSYDRGVTWERAKRQ